MVTMQLHVLGVVIVLPLARRLGRRPRRPPPGGDADGARARSAAGSARWRSSPRAYLPLLAYELGTGFAEIRAILDYLAGGGREAAVGRSAAGS